MAMQQPRLAAREHWGWTDGRVRIVTRDRRGRFTSVQIAHNLITSAGKNLLRDVLRGAVTDGAIKYIGVGQGVGTLTTALTSGNVYTTLATTALNRALAGGASITLVNGTTTQTLTVGGGGAGSGATVVTVSSFTASANFPIGTAVILMPAATDTQLTSEQFRKAVTKQSTTGTAGECVTTIYLSPQDATTFTIGVIGWFAGASASSAANSGVLVALLPYQRAKTASESISIDRSDLL